jgi:glutamate N-acetyltransferase/amino-acid N-acetyltransferase
VDLRLGKTQVVRRGAACKHAPKAAKQAVAGLEVQIIVDLNTGSHEAEVWTCDLTAEYVRINAEYHT